jgi:transcriptional regulator with XRE-family HTH domain
MPRKKFPVNLVGPQIRKARYRMGFSQAKFVARCQMAGLDISRATLAQIEIRMRYVTDEELGTFALLLKTSPNDLYPSDVKRRFKIK